LNNSEAIAKGVLESVVPGATMHYHTVQSGGMHDFDLEYPDGRIVPVEVTASVDEQWMSTIAAIRRPRTGGQFVCRVKCRKDWYVIPQFRESLSINEIRQSVDTYLADIEAEGRDRFVAPADAYHSPTVRRIWSELGIEAGYTLVWNPPGRIGIALPGQVARIDAKAVEAAVLAEAAKSDNLKKLRVSSAAERHLFVYISPSNWPVWASINEGTPPPNAPNLPPEVTHVWAVAMTRHQNKYVVWTATATSHWVRPSLVRLTAEQLAALRHGPGDEQET
jgi:hypothetical protein